MTDLRAAREAAYWEHWRKALRDNPRDGLPAFLDALDAIDEARNLSELPRTGAEAAEWALPAPGGQVSPARTPPVPVSGQVPKAPPRSRTGTRTRRGGTAT